MLTTVNKVVTVILLLFVVISYAQENATSSWQRITQNLTDDFHASYSPDGKTILFDSDRTGHNEVYSYNVLTRQTTQLTNSSFKSDHPKWMRKGEYIVYEMYDTGLEVYKMKVDGSGKVKLTDSSGHNAAASESPDGKQILFLSTRNGNWDLYVMNTDGDDLKQLTFNTGDDVGAQWSPDGSMIVFMSEIEGNWEICSVNTDGSNYRQLTHNKSTDEGPRWSPDGRKIMFSSNAEGGVGKLYFMNATGGELTKLTDLPGSSEGIWSPDGTRILFVSGKDNDADILIMNSDGSDLKNLTRNKFREANPSWAPDSKSVLFVSAIAGNLEIYSLPLRK
jgi:Tol biopolymer transport system component